MDGLSMIVAKSSTTNEPSRLLAYAARTITRRRTLHHQEDTPLRGGIAPTPTSGCRLALRYTRRSPVRTRLRIAIRDDDAFQRGVVPPESADAQRRSRHDVLRSSASGVNR